MLQHHWFPTPAFSRLYSNKMTLIHDIKSNISNIPYHALRPWLVIMVLMTALQSLPADWQVLLRFDRDALAAGETWRLLSANFIHLGWNHLLLNVAGFLLIGWLFADQVSPAVWLLVLLACCLSASLGLYWWTPDVYWVVGMSGALHGLFVFGVCVWIGQGDRLAWGLLAGVTAKLLWEQSIGAMPFSEGVVGGKVVTDAHLWGALGGLATGVAYSLWYRFRARL